MPPAEVKHTLPSTGTNAGKKKAPRQWDVATLNETLIEAFVQLRGDRLLTRASNEWKRVVEKVPGLTKGEYPLALADIVEVALVSVIELWIRLDFILYFLDLMHRHRTSRNREMTYMAFEINSIHYRGSTGDR